MRSAISAVLLVLGLSLTAVAGPAFWVQKNVVDTEGFVQLAAPIGADPAVQAQISSIAARSATDAIDLPDGLQDLAQNFIEIAAGAIQSDPGYPQAWQDLMRRSHQKTLAAATDASPNVFVDSTPVVQLIAHKAASAAGLEAPKVADVVLSFDVPQLRNFLPAAQTLGGSAPWMALGALVALLATVIVAKRRGIALLLVGLGVAVVALVWQLGAGAAKTQLPQLVGGDDAVTSFTAKVTDYAVADWQAWVNWGYIGAGILVVAAVVTIMVSRASKH